jgi:hypothetical protein
VYGTLEPASEGLDDLLLAGEASGVVLGEDLLVIDADDEDAAAAADELRLEAELLPDLRRQTGGAREVVSDAAVVDAYVHSVFTRIAVTLSNPPRSFAMSISF